MLVEELIYRYNDERPNDIEDLRKLTYVRACEKLIMNEVILTHEWDEGIKAQIEEVLQRINETEMLDAIDEDVLPSQLNIETMDVMKYFDEFTMNTKLFAPEPYDDLYFHYIDMKIASAQNESKRYNQASTMYNNSYISYQDYYNRTHLPKSVPARYVHHSLL